MRKHSAFTSLSIAALIVGAVIFGMILAGVLDIGSNGNAIPTPQQTLAPQQTPTHISNFVDVAKVISPAVVAITSTQIKETNPHQSMSPDMFRWFFGPNRQPSPNQGDGEKQKVQAGGSGFIISPDGFIVTNNHVIEGADKVEVRLNREGADNMKAEVIGADPATDIALLKIKTKEDLPYLQLSDSDAIQLGEWVMAAGYPLVYGYTVTAGIVSAKGKRLGMSPTTSSFENFIQTDAAINFGNSGGPLVNIHGQVIGINTAIAARGQNIGFAVPINQFKMIEKQLKKRGKVVRGYLGVKIREVDRDIQEAFNLPGRNGAFVESVEKDTPAEKAGVEHGDVIVKVDDVVVKKTTDLIYYISSREPGTKVSITVIRDGRKKTLKATLTERNLTGEEEDIRKPSKEKGSAEKRLGIRVRPLTDQMRRYYRIESDIKGLIITHVNRVSPAADARLREGDIVTEVNGKAVSDVEAFEKAVSKIKEHGLLRLYVLRPGQQPFSFFAIIRLDE